MKKKCKRLSLFSSTSRTLSTWSMQTSGVVGGNSLYMTWYGCAARIAPFFSAARYKISPLFPRKLYMTDHFFFLEWYMKGPNSLHLCLNVHIFAPVRCSAQRPKLKQNCIICVLILSIGSKQIMHCYIKSKDSI